MINASLVDIAIECGASRAEHIEPSRLVTSAVFRSYCEDNVCGFYGKCWSCPPDIGDIEALQAELRCYEHILLYQQISQVKDYSDAESMDAAGASFSDLSQRLHVRLRELFARPFLHLGGSCRLCPECTKLVDEPCRYPEKMIPSLSAYGVDVCKSCEGSSLQYMNGDNTVTYFGMVLYNE